MTHRGGRCGFGNCDANCVSLSDSWLESNACNDRRDTSPTLFSIAALTGNLFIFDRYAAFLPPPSEGEEEGELGERMPTRARARPYTPCPKATGSEAAIICLLPAQILIRRRAS